MAGFIYGMVQGCDVEGCVRYGNITGAACVEAVGCLTHYVTEAQLLKSCKAIYG